MKGSYVLIIELKKNKEIKIGKLGNIPFRKGYYAYIGSALNNLEKRIKRHLKKVKNIHWHIDYFLKNSEIIEIYYKENTSSEECSNADRFKQILSFIPEFGCSDCNCKSHLFYGEKKDLNDVIKKLKCEKIIIN
jgi:Uri superfamily endonuclease